MKCRFGEVPIIGRTSCPKDAVVRILVAEQGTFAVCQDHFEELTVRRVRPAHAAPDCCRSGGPSNKLSDGRPHRRIQTTRRSE